MIVSEEGKHYFRYILFWERLGLYYLIRVTRIIVLFLTIFQIKIRFISFIISRHTSYKQAITRLVPAVTAFKTIVFPVYCSHFHFLTRDLFYFGASLTQYFFDVDTTQFYFGHWVLRCWLLLIDDAELSPPLASDLASRHSTQLAVSLAPLR
jgi:hypothetical protein